MFARALPQRTSVQTFLDEPFLLLAWSYFTNKTALNTSPFFIALPTRSYSKGRFTFSTLAITTDMTNPKKFTYYCALSAHFNHREGHFDKVGDRSTSDNIGNTMLNLTQPESRPLSSKDTLPPLSRTMLCVTLRPVPRRP